MFPTQPTQQVGGGSHFKAARGLREEEVDVGGQIGIYGHGPLLGTSSSPQASENDGTGRSLFRLVKSEEQEGNPGLFSL